MKREVVDSSMIRSVGYDPETRTLELEFQSGAVWHYLEVMPGVHTDLMAAESLGSYARGWIIGEYDERLISKKRRR